MKIDKNTTREILSRYRDLSGRETLRHFMPVEVNGEKWCSATDGHQVILIPENDENKLEKPEEKTVNIASIIPVFYDKIPLKISDIKAVYNSVPIIDVPETKICDSCDGNGEFNHYRYTYGCKACDENGVIKTGTVMTNKSPETIFAIRDSFVKIQYLVNILWVAGLVKCDEIFILKSDSQISFYQVDEIIIGIASMMISDTDKRPIITII